MLKSAERQLELLPVGSNAVEVCRLSRSWHRDLFIFKCSILPTVVSINAQLSLRLETTMPFRRIEVREPITGGMSRESQADRPSL